MTSDDAIQQIVMNAQCGSYRIEHLDGSDWVVYDILDANDEHILGEYETNTIGNERWVRVGKSMKKSMTMTEEIKSIIPLAEHYDRLMASFNPDYGYEETYDSMMTEATMYQSVTGLRESLNKMIEFLER